MKPKFIPSKPQPKMGCIGLLIVILPLLANFFTRFIRVICELGIPTFRPREHPTGRSRNPCMPVPPHVHRRPDPMIYSQKYLKSQGLAVTWNNPDIVLQQNGVTVPSHELKPATTYQIVARIWNGSVEAPALNMPVQFSYLQFGAGAKKNPIGDTLVNVPVKGAAGLPVLATMDWTTPSTPGHYCIQVNLVWSDDKNPLNNLGQENVDVKPLNSPHADFTFVVENTEHRQVTLQFEADFYAIGARPTCRDKTLAPSNKMTDSDIAVHRRIALNQHSPQLFAVPENWQIEIDPPELTLEHGESVDVHVDVIAPDDFRGQQPININALLGDDLYGGVTLYVHSDDARMGGNHG